MNLGLPRVMGPRPRHAHRELVVSRASCSSSWSEDKQHPPCPLQASATQQADPRAKPRRGQGPGLPVSTRDVVPPPAVHVWETVGEALGIGSW